MKKYLAIILALAMALCLCACTGNDTDPDTSEDNPAVSDSSASDASADDDALVVDLDALDKDKDSEGDTDATDGDDADDEDAESSGDDSAAEDTAPKRTQFSDADKEAAKAAAVEMVKADNQQQDAVVYELKVTDLYNCVVTVGYKVMESEKETLFLADYDLHYDNDQWVKTAAYNRGSFDTSIYDIGYDEAGALVITPKQG